MKLAGRISVVLLVIVLALASIRLLDPFQFTTQRPPIEKHQNTVYVWQAKWSDAVIESIRESASRFDGIAVLAAEADGNEMAVKTIAVDWPALGSTQRPITAVLRINSGLSANLRKDFGTSSARVMDWTAALEMNARSQGVALAGIQLDYDCPTASLGDYRALVNKLRAACPDMHLSITALPTWLSADDFKGLVNQLDDYVLQVHSLEKPNRIDDQVSLCDPEKALLAARAASKHGVPFFVALPTYGYRLLFDDTGTFVALTAEGAPTPSRAVAARELQADPAEIAGLVRELKENRPAYCLGIAWFRLPIATDTMNWSMAALDAVMRGEAPNVKYDVELRTPQSNLYELWITNTGDTTIPTPIHVDVSARNGTVIASDFLGIFQGTPDGAGGFCISGPLPRPGQQAMAAWFRVKSRGGEPPEMVAVKKESGK